MKNKETGNIEIISLPVSFSGTGDYSNNDERMGDGLRAVSVSVGSDADYILEPGSGCWEIHSYCGH